MDEGGRSIYRGALQARRDAREAIRGELSKLATRAVEVLSEMLQEQTTPAATRRMIALDILNRLGVIQPEAPEPPPYSPTDAAELRARRAADPGGENHFEFAAVNGHLVRVP